MREVERQTASAIIIAQRFVISIADIEDCGELLLMRQPFLLCSLLLKSVRISNRPGGFLILVF